MPPLRPSRDLLADRVVLQPYGFWHRPALRTAVVVLALMFGVFAASWLFAPRPVDTGELRAENELLRARLAAAARALEAERARAAELEREKDAVAREVQRLREELTSAGPEKAAKRRERRTGGDEAVATRRVPARDASPAAPAPAPESPAPPAPAPAPAPPRAE